MNGMYLALKLACHECLINVNHYFVSVLISIVVEDSMVGSYLSKPACQKGRGGREGTDGQMTVKEGIHVEDRVVCIF